jgi:hypothetical protein
MGNSAIFARFAMAVLAMRPEHRGRLGAAKERREWFADSAAAANLSGLARAVIGYGGILGLQADLLRPCATPAGAPNATPERS